jgi:hypothetical protein
MPGAPSLAWFAKVGGCSSAQIGDNPFQQFPRVHHLRLPPFRGEMAFVARHQIVCLRRLGALEEAIVRGIAVTVSARRGRTIRAAFRSSRMDRPTCRGLIPNLGRRSTPSYSVRTSSEAAICSLPARARSRTCRSKPSAFRCADTTTFVSSTTRILFIGVRERAPAGKRESRGQSHARKACFCPACGRRPE